MRDEDVEAMARPRDPATPAVSQSFEDFFEIEHDRLLGALYLITGNKADAEELMQDAFLKIWERWDLVQSLADPTGYLYRTAMNGFRMRYRHALVVARRLLPGRPQVDPFEEVEVRQDVRAALRSLQPRQRAALVLTELLGFSSSEAGQTLGIKDSTVRALATQARAALRATIGSDRDE
jgi:RNA polymerase sigma-70 factor (ECF subfamily)